MEYIENRLAITFPEMVSCNVSTNYLKRALHRQRKGELSCWEHAKPSQTIFIFYDGLKQEYKTRINNKFFGGNTPDDLPTKKLSSLLSNPQTTPETSIKHHISTKVKNFESHLKENPIDEKTITEFRTASGTLLPRNEKFRCIQAVSVLAFVGSMNRNKKQLAQLGFKNSKEFWDTAIEYIKTNNLPLRKDEARLRTQATNYLKHGAETVISGHYKRKPNNKKVFQIQEDVILHLMGLHNNLTAVQGMFYFNQIAKEKGWEPICEKTVRDIFSKNKIQIIGSRSGGAAFKNKFLPSILRQQTTIVNTSLQGDGKVFELFYQKPCVSKKGGNYISYWERKVVYWVIDSATYYIMGYCIGDSENIELAKTAWKNACVNNGILPKHVKTDNYAKSTLKPFYESLCEAPHYYNPSSVGNPQDKSLEPMGARFDNEVTRLMPNYSGRNITSKEILNRDYLDKIKKTFPNEEQVIQQIEACINEWNTKPREKHNGLSIEQVYQQADKSNDRKLTDLKRLELFGVERQRKVTFTNKGLVIEINGETYNYRDWDNKELMESIGVEFTVKYDPCDLSKILITANDERIKFLVNQEKKIPMVFSEYKEGDGKLLQERLNEKKRIIKENIIDKATAREQRLKEENIDISLFNENSAMGLYKLSPVLNGEQKRFIQQSENAVKAISTEDKSYHSTILHPINQYDSEVNEEFKVVE